MSSSSGRSSKGDDDLEKCPRCGVAFVTDATALPRKIVPRPVSCGQCGGYTLCYVCVAAAAARDDPHAAAIATNADATAVFQCPACRQVGGFIANIAFCRALDRIRSLKAAAAAESSTSQHAAAKKKRSSTTRRGLKAAEHPIKLEESHQGVAHPPPLAAAAPDMVSLSSSPNSSMGSSIKTEATAGAAGPEQQEQRLLEVNQRVFCIWPDDRRAYYPGRIVAVRRSSAAAPSVTTYSVKFDDNDELDPVKRCDILTQSEAEAEDLVKVEQQQASAILTLPKNKHPHRQGGRSDNNNNNSTNSKRSRNGHPIVRNAAPSLVPAPAALTETTTTTANPFMTAPLFHLNSFMRSGVRNEGFVPFIREQVAAIGFPSVDETVLALPRGTKQERKHLRDAIWQCWGERFPDHLEAVSGARQMALWLSELTVGSWIMIRHEIKNCPFRPKMLQRPDGTYAGPVYVLGEVTAIFDPFSEENKEITQRIPELEMGWSHSYCRVRFNKMGRKDALSPATQKYISAICQPTLAHICEVGRTWPKLETDAERVRADLWRNAVYDIGPHSLDDHFFWSI